MDADLAGEWEGKKHEPSQQTDDPAHHHGALLRVLPAGGVRSPPVPFRLILFCAASYTDHLDGKIARRDNLITNFGKLMDPLADKILVVSALICMVRLDLASTVCVLLIMVREFAITSIRLLAVEQGRVIAANNWGKLKTVSQMVAIIAILLMQYIGTFVPAALPGMTLAGQVLIVIATFFTVVSGVIYIKDNRDVIKG